MSMNVISYPKYLELNGRPPITDVSDPNYDSNVAQCSISLQSIKGISPENVIFTTCCKTRDMQPIFRVYLIPVFKEMLLRSNGTCPFCKKQLQVSSIMTFSEKLYILACRIFRGNGFLGRSSIYIGYFAIGGVLHELPIPRSVAAKTIRRLVALTVNHLGLANGIILLPMLTEFVARKLGMENSPVANKMIKIALLLGMAGSYYFFGLSEAYSY